MSLRITCDIDGTIASNKTTDGSYADIVPLPDAVESLRKWKLQGHYIILQTARHMRTCNGNEGKVLAMGGKLLFDWLTKWEIPYDEVYFGKPHSDIFIDDAGYKFTTWKNADEEIKNLDARGGRFG